jgi:hypothetical protein
VAEPTWPSPRIETRTLALGPGSLEAGDVDEVPVPVSSPQTTGLDGGEWCAFGADGELPDDQRADDARSICFDTAPLAEPLEILGAPVVTLDLAADRPTAIVAVRLNDVAPGGAVTRVTYGLLNLAHRDGHAEPSALEPGRRYRVRIRLNDVAHAFPAGHRLRLALSTAYWPIAWPSAEAATVTVLAGRSVLDLPVRPPRAEDAALRPFAPPERGPGGARAGRRRPALVRLLTRDPRTSETECTVETDGDGGTADGRIEAIDLDVGFGMQKCLRIAEHDPTSARAAMHLRTTLRRGAWSVRIETSTELTATAGAFRLVGSLRALEGERAVFRRDWDVAIRRDLV